MKEKEGYRYGARCTGAGALRIRHCGSSPWRKEMTEEKKMQFFLTTLFFIGVVIFFYYTQRTGNRRIALDVMGECNCR